MKNAMLLLALFIISGLVTLISFQYGSSNPDYTLTDTEKELCKSLSVKLPEYKEISYTRGFPFKLVGTDVVNVACISIDNYIPAPKDIVNTWQFYANLLVYTSALVGLSLLLKNVVLHHPSES